MGLGLTVLQFYVCMGLLGCTFLYVLFSDWMLLRRYVSPWVWGLQFYSFRFACVCLVMIVKPIDKFESLVVVVSLIGRSHTPRGVPGLG